MHVLSKTGRITITFTSSRHSQHSVCLYSFTTNLTFSRLLARRRQLKQYIVSKQIRTDFYASQHSLRLERLQTAALMFPTEKKRLRPAIDKANGQINPCCGGRLVCLCGRTQAEPSHAGDWSRTCRRLLCCLSASQLTDWH